LTLYGTGQVQNVGPRAFGSVEFIHLRIPLSFPPFGGPVWTGFGGPPEKLRVLRRPFMSSPGIPVERGPATLVVE